MALLTLQVRQTHGQWVQLMVRDRGPGIPDEIARQRLTPFFPTRSAGMGLGLSVFRTIVEQHGGALDFVNVRDAGGAILIAECHFTLPAAPAPALRIADRADATMAGINAP